MHYNHHGQLWSRYPSGPASLKAGTKVFQKNAYLVSPWPEKDATGRIEQLRHQSMNPLDRRFQTPSDLDNTGVNGTPLARFGETRETAPLKAEIWKRMREVQDEQLDSDGCEYRRPGVRLRRPGAKRDREDPPRRSRTARDAAVHDFIVFQGGGDASAKGSGNAC